MSEFHLNVFTKGKKKFVNKSDLVDLLTVYSESLDTAEEHEQRLAEIAQDVIVAFIRLLTRMGQPDNDDYGYGEMGIKTPQNRTYPIPFWFRPSDGLFLCLDSLASFVREAPERHYHFLADILEDVKEGKLPVPKLRTEYKDW